ncbi:MAG: lipase [Oscillospiraceae bacterium]|nr:lipase [Oscillospiraceae bacterium]
MTPRIVCYGDSNTYGYDGTDPFGGRLPAASRWPDILAGLLGCECVNCGLNGRTVPHVPRTVQADLALLRRQAPCTLVIVMLGTNDLLTFTEPEETAERMRSFLTALRENLPKTAVLLCAPPPVGEFETGWPEAFGTLAGLYKELAEELGTAFTDAGLWGIETAGDGVHFSQRGHRVFAVKMGQTVRALLA